MEANKPYAIKKQRGASKNTPNRGFGCEFFMAQATLWPMRVDHTGQHFYFSCETRQLRAVPRGFVSCRFHLFIFDILHPDRHAELGRLEARPGRGVWWMFRDVEISIITSECILYVLHNESCRWSSWYKKAIHSSSPCPILPMLLCCTLVLANLSVLTFPKFMTFQGTHSDSRSRQWEKNKEGRSSVWFWKHSCLSYFRDRATCDDGEKRVSETEYSLRFSRNISHSDWRLPSRTGGKRERVK